MTKIGIKQSDFPINHTLFGVLFGCCFPLASSLISAYSTYGAITLDTLLAVQRNNLLLWVIDSAPFFLGLAFFIAGKYQLNALKNLESQQIAEAGSQAKSAFLANMSHEIRTPITTIVGSVELLQGTEATAEQREHYNTIKITADLLLNIINNILDLSKIEANKIELDNAPFSFEDVLRNALKLVSQRALVKNLDLFCEVDPHVPDRLIGDRIRLQQILVNLLSNAVKFTAEGHIEIKVTHQVSHDQRVQLCISVQDTGIGMSQEQQSRIFEAFGQADTSINRRFAGTGLGLTICKQLVEAMGGQISVKSSPTVGSTFTITPRFSLPAAAQKADAPLPPSLNDVSVLVVDPCPRNRQVVSTILQHVHMHPRLAANCEEGLQAIAKAQREEHPIRIALIDSGIEQTQIDDCLLKLNSGEDKPIVLLMQPDGAPPAYANGQLLAGATIYKPILRRAFLKSLSETLAQRGDSTIVSRRTTPPPPNMAGKRILVADDNDVNRSIFLKMLSATGACCEGAVDGLHAVELAQEKEFDIIFMDLHMPRLGGLEATQRLRAAEPAGERAIIVALTADAVSGIEAECLAAGMDAFLVKPIRLKEIFNFLEERFPTQSTHPGA